MAKDVLGADKIIWGTDSPCVLTKFDYKDLYSFIEDSDVFTDASRPTTSRSFSAVQGFVGA